MTAQWSMRFDRRISDELLDVLRPDGWLHALVARRNASPMSLDLQGRRAPAGRDNWISLYAGLSRIVNVHERGGEFRVQSHPTYQRIGGFDPSWARWQGAADLAREWPAVEGYIDAVLADAEVLPRYLRREGQVHPLLCAGLARGYRVVQREAIIAFPSSAAKQAAIDPVATRIYGAIGEAGRSDAWWPGVRDRGKWPPLGSEVDVLGIDDTGRLLVIEAKPADEVKGIAWAPAQVGLYAQLFAELLTVESGAADILDEMLAQRVDLGLTPSGGVFARPMRVVPVVAIGAGPMSPMALERLSAVSDAIGSALSHPSVDALEVWILDGHGGIERHWRPSEQPVLGEPSAVATIQGSFVAAARRAAITWKETTTALPSEARDPAPYRGIGSPLPFCLPVAFSALNLLPDARDIALARFDAAGIPWHQGIGAGPSNHLLSSQVQCANCLAPLVDRPDALARLFGSVLPIGEIIAFGAHTPSPFDLTDHVVFEWIGLSDHLDERGGDRGVRGANTTSADAAIRYRATSGDTEIALIEWKYTEQYQGHELSGGQTALDTRRARYRHLWRDPDGPLRTDLIPYDDLFVEPFYQLLRLQLLAWRLEATHELDAEVVRLVYVAPGANIELASSFNRPTHATLGESGRQPVASTVWDAWASMQRRPDRFAWMDSADLVGNASPCSDELKARYGHLGAAGTARSQVAAEDDVRRLRSACSDAISILGRISADHGVLAQVLVLDDHELQRAPSSHIREITMRLEEISELARRARAEEIAEILHRGEQPR